MDLRKAGRVFGLAAAAILGLYESTRVTVRLPLAVPVALIGVVMLVLALAFRGSPRQPTEKPQKEIPAPTPPAWEFDDDRPSEESS